MSEITKADRNSAWYGGVAAAGMALLLAALPAANAQISNNDALQGDSYFDTPNWAEDDYGFFDRDFDWQTEDEWFTDWNDTHRSAWNDSEEAQWHVFGYDDADEWGLFDW